MTVYKKQTKINPQISFSTTVVVITQVGSLVCYANLEEFHLSSVFLPKVTSAVDRDHKFKTPHPNM